MTKEGTIQLTTPLKINGEDYTELTHDIGKITIEDLAEIERERNEMLGPKAGTIFRVAQNDNLMHTLLGIKCSYRNNKYSNCRNKCNENSDSGLGSWIRRKRFLA